jgi:hypothetical protein
MNLNKRLKFIRNGIVDKNDKEKIGLDKKRDQQKTDPFF